MFGSPADFLSACVPILQSRSDISPLELITGLVAASHELLPGNVAAISQLVTPLAEGLNADERLKYRKAITKYGKALKGLLPKDEEEDGTAGAPTGRPSEYKVASIAKIERERRTSTNQPGPADILVLCALEKEYVAVVSKLNGATEESNGVHTWSTNAISDLTVLVYSVNASGNVPTGAELGRLLELCKPSVVILAGIAAGFSSDQVTIREGDVIVPQQIVGYQSAKVAEAKVEIRLRVAEIEDSKALESATSLALDRNWLEMLVPNDQPRPSVHFGAELCGEEVVANGLYRDSLRDLYPNIVALEMEAIGVVTAAYAADTVPQILIAKSACDDASGLKDDHAHPWACETSAAFVVSLLHRLAPSLPRTPRKTKLRKIKVEQRVRYAVVSRIGDYLDQLIANFNVPDEIEWAWDEKGGSKARQFWDWCVKMNLLSDLPSQLRAVGREDLADLFFVDTLDSP